MNPSKIVDHTSTRLYKITSQVSILFSSLLTLRYKEIYNGPHKTSGFGIVRDREEWLHAPGDDPPPPKDDPRFRDEDLGDLGAFDWIWVTMKLT